MLMNKIVVPGFSLGRASQVIASRRRGNLDSGMLRAIASSLCASRNDIGNEVR